MSEQGNIFIPREIPRWMYEAFRRLQSQADVSTIQIAAVGRGESPDGSGQPLLDLSGFFFLPGKSGGQIGIQLDPSFPALTLQQDPIVSTAVELLRLYTDGKMIQFLPGTFTLSCTTVATTTTLTAAVGSFTPTGGPRVTEGMILSGTGIPTDTMVKSLDSSTTLTMSAAATASGTITVTFQTKVYIQVKTDETGKDIEWRSFGGIRFTPGSESVPLRISGNVAAIATGIAASAKVYLECGYIDTGVSIGTDFVIGGPGHGELFHMNILARTLWLTRSTASGTDNCVGISGSENPATYGSGVGPAASLIVGNNRGPATFIGSTASGPILQVRDVSTGTSPTRALGGLIFSVERDNTLGFYPIRFEDPGSAVGFYFRAAANDNFLCYQKSNDLEMFTFTRVSTWGDSLAIANSFIHTLGTLNGGHRAYLLTSSGNGAFTRFGIRSAYTLIGNGNISSSDFPAPEANPTVLRIINGVTGGNDASVGMKLESLRTGATADLFQGLSAVSGAATCLIDNKAHLQVSIKSSSFWTDSTDLTKKLALDLSAITTATTRTLGIQNYSGTVMIVGNDAPAVAAGSLGKVDLTGQTANIASTNLSNGAITGVMYEVQLVVQCTTADAAAGTITVAITATEATGARTLNTLRALTSTGSTTNVGRWLVSSGEISYSVTVTGSFGTAQYAVFLRVIALG